MSPDPRSSRRPYWLGRKRQKAAYRGSALQTTLGAKSGHHASTRLVTLSQQNSQSGAESGASMDVVANFGVAEGGYHRPRVCALSSRLRPLYRPIPIDECSEDLLSDGWRLYGQLRRQMASSRPVRLSPFNRGVPNDLYSSAHVKHVDAVLRRA